MDIREETREYFDDVRGIAEDIMSEVKAGDLDRDDVWDAVHERVDGSQWVIYTYRAKLVVAFISDNDSAAYDEGMDIDHSEGINWSALAYFAMAEDVRVRLADMMDDLDDA